MDNPLTRNQKRYLSRFVCAWCDQTLDQDTCGAGWGKCSADERARRRKTMLETELKETRKKENAT